MLLFHSIIKEDESRGVGVVHELLRAGVVAIFFFFVFFFFFFFFVVVVGGPKIIRSIRLPPKFHHQSEEAKCDSENDRRARVVVLRDDDAKEPGWIRAERSVLSVKNQPVPSNCQTTRGRIPRYSVLIMSSIWATRCRLRKAVRRRKIL